MTAENLPPWARMAIGYDGDPKVAALARFGEEAGLCRDLHLAMIRYCRREGTDGWVPPEEPGRLAWPLPPDRAKVLVDHLAEVELIAAANGDRMAGAMAGAMAPAMAGGMAGAMAGGWRVLNYAKWQETTAEIEAYSKMQAERGRLGAARRWSEPGSMAGAMRSPRRADSARDGGRVAEVEIEIDKDPSAHAPAREAPPGDGDDLDGLIQALMFSKTGQTVTREEAAAIRSELLTGRAIDNPAAWIRKCIGTKAEARRLRPTRDRAATAGTPAREIIDRHIRRPGGPTKDPHHWADIARKGLHAETEPDHLDLDGQADDELDAARSEQLANEPAEVLTGEIVPDPDPDIPY